MEGHGRPWHGIVCATCHPATGGVSAPASHSAPISERAASTWKSEIEGGQAEIRRGDQVELMWSSGRGRHLLVQYAQAEHDREAFLCFELGDSAVASLLSGRRKLIRALDRAASRERLGQRGATRGDRIVLRLREEGRCSGVGACGGTLEDRQVQS